MTTVTISRRDQAMGSAVTLITNLLRAVLWLIKHGVHVQGFRGWRSDAGVDRVAVVVTASPYLYHLMPDATWLRRRQEGCLVIYTYFAVRKGISIEWEESCAYPVQ